MRCKRDVKYIVSVKGNGTSYLAFKAPVWLMVLGVALGPGGALLAAQAEVAGERPVDLTRKSASRLLVTQVKPEYPSIARVNYIRGQVRLLVRVGRNGKVSFAHVVQGHPFLAASALEAVRQWVYRPYLTAAGPAEFETLVDVNFSLVHSKPDRLPLDAEQYLTLQVHPPQAPATTASASTGFVRMRVLVDGGGQAIDATLLEGRPSVFQAARKIVDGWKFRPARWGNLMVPWYVEVSVPMSGAQPAEGESPLAAVPTGG